MLVSGGGKPERGSLDLNNLDAERQAQKIPISRLERLTSSLLVTRSTN